MKRRKRLRTHSEKELRRKLRKLVSEWIEGADEYMEDNPDSLEDEDLCFASGLRNACFDITELLRST